MLSVGPALKDNIRFKVHGMCCYWFKEPPTLYSLHRSAILKHLKMTDILLRLKFTANLDRRYPCRLPS